MAGVGVGVENRLKKKKKKRKHEVKHHKTVEEEEETLLSEIEDAENEKKNNNKKKKKHKKQKTCEINEIVGGEVEDFDGIGAKDGNDDRANELHQVVAHAESRVSIPPLEVMLDETDSVVENVESGTKELISKASSNGEKNKTQSAKKAKQKRELEIRAAEQRLLENDAPQTPEEYEKLVRGSPNQSKLWIKYMDFMKSLADIEKARSIAERALRTINYREEAEKFKVWIACLDLENQHGNPQEEAVMKTFQKALQYCDPEQLHLALLNMYERTEQHRQANKLLDKMTKKFKHSVKVWYRKVESLLKQEKEGIQSTVKRALLCLPQREHINFIRDVAILEYKHGVPDRGRSMFEELLRNNPKKIPLWQAYIDKEIKLGDKEIIRALFERATCLSIRPKQMKGLFKKYLNYEKAFGDEERIEYIKRKAMEYIDSLN